ncbi:hypothetical protein [Azotobacter chroococcum]|uniref:hypothetical protein n=1 Tax=Azotobacter chroococcum TaxID=353 RepID=UPI0010AEE462|nr:hypothetical protein [Azotobacter chroococcum]TKD35301.1 hypothetical protein FCG41_17835 [Azotobacter chroococcum]
MIFEKIGKPRTMINLKLTHWFLRLLMVALLLLMICANINYWHEPYKGEDYKTIETYLKIIILMIADIIAFSALLLVTIDCHIMASLKKLDLIKAHQLLNWTEKYSPIKEHIAAINEQGRPILMWDYFFLNGCLKNHIAKTNDPAEIKVAEATYRALENIKMESCQTAK